MQTFTADAANTVTADMVARSNGAPITTGTVTFYLYVVTGTNAGKWFKASDDTFSATEVSAGAGTHKSDGHWTVSIGATAWDVGVRYMLYAKESGDLHIPYSETMVEGLSEDTGLIAFTYTVTDSTTGLPISGCKVWVTTDSAGANVIRDDTTDSSGQVIFYLTAGSYYFFRSADGWTFTNPDLETVSA